MLKSLRPSHIGKILLLTLSLALIVAFVLNASKPGESIEGCPEGCARQVERGAGPLRIVSLNMLHGFPDFKDLPLRLDLITGEIRRLDADVVLLQEAPWTRATGYAAKFLAQQLGYNYLYYRANGNRKLIFFEEGEAILSRYPLTESASAVLPPNAGFFERRVVLKATAATPWGNVSFFVAHLTDKAPGVNRGEAESLRAFVEAHKEGLAVVAGDFNAREDSPQIVDLAGRWIDAYRTVHPGDKGLTCCIDNLAAGPGEPLEERIDYVFLAPQIGKNVRLAGAWHAFDRPVAVGSRWQWASDHTGLLVEIEP